ncbi:MAG: hypothetical protein HQL30_04355 [Candidatus Omnitrophica bacterium]|nr:hypothetical protein [Candidatus Omnitrophota bacterium]
MDRMFHDAGKRLLNVSRDPFFSGDILNIEVVLKRGKGEGLKFKILSKARTMEDIRNNPSCVDIRRVNGEDKVLAGEESKFFAPEWQIENSLKDIPSESYVDPKYEYTATCRMLDEVYRELLVAAGLPEKVYKIKLIKDESYNIYDLAYSPYVVVNVGCLRTIQSFPSEARKHIIAFLLAHEIEHKKQSREKIIRGGKPERFVSIPEYLRLRFERYANEYEADNEALFTMDKAGYSVKYIDILYDHFLAKGSGKVEMGMLNPWSYHPDLGKRAGSLSNTRANNAWKSIDAVKPMPKEIDKEVPPVTELSKFLSRMHDIEKLGSEYSAEKVHFFEGYHRYADEAKDYESLLAFMHYFYAQVFLYHEEGYPKSLFVENGLIAFLKKARKLNAHAGDMRYRIFEQTVVDFIFDECENPSRTVMEGVVRSRGINRDRVYRESGCEPFDIYGYLNNATKKELIDFISFWYPDPENIVIPGVFEDVFALKLFAGVRGHTDDIEKTPIMFRVKEYALEKFYQLEWKKGSTVDLASALYAVRQLYNNINDQRIYTRISSTSKREYYTSFERVEEINKWLSRSAEKIISLYLDISELQGTLEKDLGLIMSLYRILPDTLRHRARSGEEQGKYILGRIFELSKKDHGLWLRFLKLLCNPDNELLYSQIKQQLSFYDADVDGYVNEHGLPFPVIYDDIDEMLEVLSVFFRIGERDETYDKMGFIFFASLFERHLSAPEKAKLWLKASLMLRPKGMDDPESGYKRDRMELHARVVNAINQMSAAERSVFLSAEMNKIGRESGFKGLDVLSDALKILVLVTYYAGPIGINTFSGYDDSDMKLVNFYSNIPKRISSSHLTPVDLARYNFDVPEGDFSPEEIKAFLDFLKASSVLLTERFDIQDSHDIDLSEDMIRDIDKMQTVEQIHLRLMNSVKTISTWREYLQVIGDHYLRRVEGEGEAKYHLSGSKKRDRRYLNLFWGESIDDIAGKSFLSDLLQAWFDPQSRETNEAVYRYSRHGHAGILRDNQRKITGNIPDEDDPDILKRFIDIRDSSLDLGEWVERIMGQYPEPTVFRNYLLYSVLVYKCLALQKTFDLDMSFDLKYLQGFMAGLPEPGRREVREKLMAITPYLTHDPRVEAVNLGIVAYHFISMGKGGASMSVRRAAKERRKQDTGGTLYMTPGGPGSQLDLLIPLIDRDYLIDSLRSKSMDFSEKLRMLILYMPSRRNSETDSFLEILIANTAGITSKEMGILLEIGSLKDQFRDDLVIGSKLQRDFGIKPEDKANRTVFYSPVVRDKWALAALSMEKAEGGIEFKSFGGELNKILHYFPEYGLTRDAVLKAFMRMSLEDKKGLDLVAPHLLENKDNYFKQEVIKRVFAKDMVGELASIVPADTRRLIFEWLIGWEPKEPPELVEFEYRYLIDMAKFREQIFSFEDSPEYPGMKEYLLRSFFDIFIDSFMEEEMTIDLSKDMLRAIAPDDKFELCFEIFQGILTAGDHERTKEVLVSMMLEWIDMRSKKEKLSKEDIQARMVKAFFQANGFLGVKLGQVLAESKGVELDEHIRKSLETLKDDVKPIDKSTAVRILDEVLPGGFDSHFKKLIGEPIGSASLKVAYKAEDLDGNIVVVKIKRPEVAVRLEKDLAYFRGIFNYIKDELPEAGIKVPANIIDELEKTLRDELDLEKEMKDQEALGEILSKRASSAGYTFRVPKGYKVYGNYVLVEEYAKGVKFTEKDELRKKGYGYSGIKGALKEEILTQIFSDGQFHLDPHAGNIMVDDHQITFMDNSLGNLRKELKRPLMGLMMHIYPSPFTAFLARRFNMGVENILKNISPVKHREGELRKLAAEIEKMLASSRGDNLTERFLAVMALLDERGFKMYEDMGRIKKCFSAADYLLNDIKIYRPRDIFMMIRVFLRMRKSVPASYGPAHQVREEPKRAPAKFILPEIEVDGGEGKPDKAQPRGEKDIEELIRATHYRGNALFNRALRGALSLYDDGGYKAGTIPAEIFVDLSLVPDKDIETNMTTLAMLVLLCRDMSNVNFSFAVSDLGEKGEVTKERKESMCKEELYAQLRKNAGYFGLTEEETAGFISGRINVQRSPGCIEVPILAKSRLEWARDNSIALSEDQYPIAMEDLKDGSGDDAFLVNFDAAFRIAMAEIALISADKMDKKANDGARRFEKVKGEIQKGLEELYKVISGGRITLDGETLDHMIYPSSSVRLNLAINMAVPEMVKLPISAIKRYHENIHGLLLSA